MYLNVGEENLNLTNVRLESALGYSGEKIQPF